MAVPGTGTGSTGTGTNGTGRDGTGTGTDFSGTAQYRYRTLWYRYFGTKHALDKTLLNPIFHQNLRYFS